MKYCEHCGEPLEDDAVFCDECGTAQTPEAEPTVEKPKSKKKVVLPIVIIIILMVAGIGGFFIYQYMNQTPTAQEELEEEPIEQTADEEDETPKTLLESADWTNDSKKIEEFKKLSLTAYPDKPIGDTFTGEYSVTEWKYATDEKNNYLLCNYTYEDQEYSLIFYQDSYSNINIAEYYIGEEPKEPEDIKTIAEELFGETEEPKEEVNTETDTSESSTNTVVASPDIILYLDGLVYTSGDEYSGTWFKLDTKANDENSFYFKFRLHGDEEIIIFNEHLAEFEDSTHAVYYGQNYTVRFEFRGKDVVYVTGMDDVFLNHIAYGTSPDLYRTFYDRGE